VADGDVVDGPVGVVYLAKFGDVTDGWVVEREPAPVAKLEDGDSGEGLGNGGPVVSGGGIDGLMRIRAGFAVKVVGGLAARVND
jgi:hypothetical protein